MDTEGKDRQIPHLWKRVVDELPLRIYTKSVDDGLRYVLGNKTFCAQVGKPWSEVVGHNAQELYPPEVAETFNAASREAVETGKAVTHDEFEYAADGIRRDLRTTEQVYTLPDGRRLLIGYSLDVTDENAQQRVERTVNDIAELPVTDENFLQSVFDIVTRPDRMDVVELRWHPNDESACVTLSSSKSDEPAVPLLETGSEDYRLTWLEHRKRIERDGLAVYSHITEEIPGLSEAFHRNDTLCLTVLPIHEPSGELAGSLMMVFRSRRRFTPQYREMLKLLARTLSIARGRIHAHRELERQLRRVNEAERAKSYFFASVSHDIRTPLNSIIGFSDLLKAGEVEPDVRRQYLDAIASSGQVLLQLVNDVLDLAKLEAGKMEIAPTMSDFRTVAREILLALLPQAQTKGLQLKTDLDPDLPFMEFDRQRIRQVLFNLVGNAVKFTEKGVVEVAAEFHRDAEGSPYGTLIFGVTDTGRGISEEDRQRLMQPYVQLSRTDQGHGTGLGLAICRQLIERMGGTLTIESTVGEGSLFRVDLPHIRFTKANPDKKDVTLTQRIRLVAGPQKRERLHVLLVDDMDLNLQVLKNMFVRLGITNVMTARSGVEALAALNAEGANYDLVFSDMWMPDMGGVDLVKRIRAEARFAHLPVYAVTADVEIMKTYREVGFTGLLLKPITLQTLTELMEGYWRGAI